MTKLYFSLLFNIRFNSKFPNRVITNLHLCCFAVKQTLKPIITSKERNKLLRPYQCTIKTRIIPILVEITILIYTYCKNNDVCTN